MVLYAAIFGKEYTKSTVVSRNMDDKFSPIYNFLLVYTVFIILKDLRNAKQRQGILLYLNVR